MHSIALIMHSIAWLMHSMAHGLAVEVNRQSVCFGQASHGSCVCCMSVMAAMAQDMQSQATSPMFTAYKTFHRVLQGTSHYKYCAQVLENSLAKYCP
jgi:hypothetical protein